MPILKDLIRIILEAKRNPEEFLRDPEKAQCDFEMPFAGDNLGVIKSKGFGDRCTLSLGAGALQAIQEKRGQLNIRRMGDAITANDVRIHIDDFIGKIQILVGSGGTVYIGKAGRVSLDLRLGHYGMMLIGDDTTVNEARIIGVNSNILVGRDGLWSDEILVQGFDQHGIVDLTSGKFINLERRTVVIGRHVWLGRRSTVMPGAEIGEGAIIGACSVVTGKVPSCTASAGAPARVVRDNVSWSRPWGTIDAGTRDFLEEGNYLSVGKMSPDK